jgi:hypothetical protein
MDEKQLPVESWGLLKLIFIPLAFFGIWMLIITFLPYYSPIVLPVGLILTMIGVFGAIMIGRGHRRIGQIALGNVLLLFMLTLSAKAWFVILGKFIPWAVWTIVILLVYILAWMLPRYNSKLSDLLVREQYTPETRIGKIILNASAKFLPIAGASGALFGMYASRDGKDHPAMLFVAITFSLVSIAFAQLTAHQFWMEDQQKAQSEERS